MAVLFDGTNDSLRSTTFLDLTLWNKISVSFWLWWDVFANDNKQALEHTPSIDANSGGFLVRPNASSGFFEISMQGLVGYSTARYTRPSSGTWHQYVAIFDLSATTNEVDLYLDGLLLTPASRPANSNNTNSFSGDFFNVMSRNNTGLFGAGRMAELTIYPGEVLNAIEVQALAKGVNPRRVRPSCNPFYWPLWGIHSSEPCLRRGLAPLLAVNGGATRTNHAPVAAFSAAPPEATMLEIAASARRQHRMALLGVGV